MKKIVLLVSFACTVIACDDILVVGNISAQTVEVLAPADGTTLTTTSVAFSWRNVPDAERYRLEIATPTFENATQIVLDSTISTTSLTTSLGANDYQWRLKAENSGYETPYTIQNFTVDTSLQIDISNESIVLLAPANGVVFTSTDTVNFSWESVSSADNYTVQIARPNFQNAIEVVETETTTNTVFSVSNFGIGEYEWRVKAENSNYETAYFTQNFIVEE